MYRHGNIHTLANTMTIQTHLSNMGHIDLYDFYLSK